MRRPSSDSNSFFFGLNFIDRCSYVHASRCDTLQLTEATALNPTGSVRSHR